jgi:hypothetical protein
VKIWLDTINFQAGQKMLLRYKKKLKRIIEKLGKINFGTLKRRARLIFHPIRCSFLIVADRRLGRGDLDAGFQEYLRIIRLFNYKYFELNEDFVMQAVAKEQYGYIDKFFDELKDESIQVRMPYFEILLHDLRKTDLKRLERYKDYYALVMGDAVPNFASEYLLIQKKYSQLEEYLATFDKSQMSALQQQFLITTMIINGKLTDASDFLKSLLVSSDSDSKVSLYKWKNLVLLAKKTNDIDVVFTNYVNDQFMLAGQKKWGEKEGKKYSKVISYAPAFYSAMGLLDEARVMLKDHDLMAIPARYARALVTLADHLLTFPETYKIIEAFYNKFKTKGYLNISVVYSEVLIANNELEKAIEVLKTEEFVARLQKGSVWLQVLTLNRLSISHEELGHLKESLGFVLQALNKDIDREGLWHRAIFLDADSGLVNTLPLFEAQKENLQLTHRTIVACSIAAVREDFEFNWEHAIITLKSNYSFYLANRMLLVAFVRKNHNALMALKDIMIESVGVDPTVDHETQLLHLATYLYKTGNKEQIKNLSNQHGPLENSDNMAYKLFFSLGVGKTIEGLHFRAMALRDTFLNRLYLAPKQQATDLRVLCPEKDLCGEVFNSFFYTAERNARGTFTVVCDARLLSIYKRNFKGINFVGKAPRRTMPEQREKFSGVPLKLCHYLDSYSLKEVGGGDFFNFDYENYYPNKDCQNNLSGGWIKPDPQLIEKWQKKLSGLGKKITIGIAATSTLQAPNRNIHMVGLEHWAEIFDIDDTVFINLNASLGLEAMQDLEKQYSITIFQPDFDLYNDFENLLALMSCLDCAILPANNLMDFASAIGLQTYIFSPTRVMSNWLIADTDSYIFTKGVQFIFPEKDIYNPLDLVGRLANEIRSDITRP